MATEQTVMTSEQTTERAAWETPAVSRIRAGEAEVTGATSDDGVIGNS